MSSKRKTTSSKKKNKAPLPEDKARNFNSDLDKLKQLNMSSFSETRIELKEHKLTHNYLSIPNLKFTPELMIQAEEILPVPNNSRTPRLGIWKFISKETISVIRQSTAKEAIIIIESLLKDKKLELESRILTSTLILTVLKWAYKKGFNDLKASTLAYCFFTTHQYFLDSSWRNQVEVYTFFKETLIYHTIENPPLYHHVFNIYECKDCLLYFCDIYLQVLPLLRCTLIPNIRIKLSWQDKKKTNSFIQDKNSSKTGKSPKK